MKKTKNKFTKDESWELYYLSNSAQVLEKRVGCVYDMVCIGEPVPSKITEYLDEIDTLCLGMCRDAKKLLKHFNKRTKK